jgi:hypothetical protein
MWTDAELLDAIRADAWPAHRVEPVDLVRREHAALAVASTDDPWLAWSRVGWPSSTAEAPDQLFQLRTTELRAVRGALRRRMERAASRMALCPSHGVPRGRCLDHPVSVSDAITFAALAPHVASIERLARAAVERMTSLGQPTHRLAAASPVLTTRRIVWRTGDDMPAKDRAQVLLAVNLLEGLSGGERVRGDLLGALGDVFPLRHNETWSHLHVVAVGAMAWRTLAALGRTVQPTRTSPGPRWFSHVEAAGRAYAELPSPFEPLLELGAHGVAVRACSSEVIVLELRVTSEPIRGGPRSIGRRPRHRLAPG